MLIVPMWFSYQSGTFLSCSPTESLLVRSLNKYPDVAFDVSTNDLPYQGVRGRGNVKCTVAKDNHKLASLIDRYTGSTDNELADTLLNRSASETVLEVEIDWLTSWDFAGRMQNITPLKTRHPDLPI